MSDDDLLISIVIPVFNDEEYLSVALESCIKQTYSNIEIIVVDDASTDKTPEIISKYARKDKRIKSIRHDKNRKTLQAIKTGVLSANGLYFMVVSGDDSFTLNAVEMCVSAIRDNPDVDIVHFGRVAYGVDGKELWRSIPNPAVLKDTEIIEKLFSLTTGSQGNFSDKCWRVELFAGVFQQVSPVKPLVLGEDQLMVFLCALLAKKYVAIPNHLHNYNFGLGMDGRSNIDLKHFLEYRMTIVDSMDELEKQLKAMKVSDWIWSHFVALKREHYAWSACVAKQLNELDSFKALKAWTDRTGIEDTLIGIANYIPDRFLDEYIAFLGKYRSEGLVMKEYREIISSIIDLSSIRIGSLKSELNAVKKENNSLRADLDSYLGVKRSAKKTLGNIRRRLKR
jgi:glycosyltransferase involved in cell wall biosynthesis